MRNRTLLKLKSLFLVHNLSLTAASGTLLALYIEGLVQILVRKGVFYAICDRRGGWTQHLVFLYYLTYLTKYLELLDTVFLFLKKKPLIGHTAVSWVPITLNLTVHVVMYWYYFQSARGVRAWWKEMSLGSRLPVSRLILWDQSESYSNQVVSESCISKSEF